MRHQRALDLLALAAHVAECNQKHAETYGPALDAIPHAEALADYRGAITVLTASAKAHSAHIKMGQGRTINNTGKQERG